jgi:hypothetical protein
MLGLQKQFVLAEVTVLNPVPCADRRQNEFKSAIPALANCMVVGDKKKFLTILLTLKTVVDAETGAPTSRLNKEAEEISKGLGSSATTVEEVVVDPLVCRKHSSTCRTLCWGLGTQSRLFLTVEEVPR